MSLKVQLNGVPYINFISAQVVRNIETAAISFAFSSSADKNNLFPIKRGDKVEILADDQLVCTGFVEGLRVRYDNSSHTIEINGRSLLADLIDSTVGDAKEFTGGISLVDVARNVLDDLGLSDIEVINKAGEIKNFDETDITSAEVGKNAFEFIESYARKRQVILTTDATGNLVLTRASNVTSNVVLKNVLGATDNNILSGELYTDESRRYNKYIAKAQLNPFDLSGGFTPKDIVDQVGEAVDSAIRRTRIYEFNSEESSDSFTLKDRSAWESNIRRARATTYTATVQGHSFNGVPPEPNFLYRIVDDFCDINAELLLVKVSFRYDLSGGSITELGFSDKRAYTLQAEAEQREEENTNQFGAGFF